MNLPNQLTIFRIILTFFFIFFLLKSTVIFTILATMIFLIASFTDFYDGYLARKYNLITNFGKIMDPIADKFLTLGAFYVFVSLNIMSAWMFWVIFAREAGITVWRLVEMRRGRAIAAENMGKYKTVLQLVSIVVILIFLILFQSSLKIDGQLLENYLGFINILLKVTVLLTLVSGLQCLIINFSKDSAHE